eukprot:TRINITY_DN7505_c0_g1_i1.p1 TRINITY_DN7505_c0_g1~~TRINITY_DN7505_c0_g1_i1.p1  ORF type:complete len:350 (+),score=102.00 TRINITY_DN7505_c0_g1_i1:77-1126(+)
MADRANELNAERETRALAKLQAAAGLVDKPQIERLDWMYEQSAVQLKKTDEELMNMPVAGSVDKDLEDVKKLSENTVGSLFLRNATKTTEDMLRKLREDPLFQIRRQEQAARASILSNPLVMARMMKKEEKTDKKSRKKVKKAAKKEKKALKKAAKKMKKAAKRAKKSSSSSSSSSSNGSEHQEDAMRVAAAPASSRRRSSPSQERRRTSSRERDEGTDLGHLGPSGRMVRKREELAKLVADRRDAALASRGAPRRMDDSEKKRKLAEMAADAAKHDRMKDQRIAVAEAVQREQDEKDARGRQNSDQKYLRDLRHEAYVGDSDMTMADRLKSQRHRRAKNLNDPLERDQ